jgi:hypothetical protein
MSDAAPPPGASVTTARVLALVALALAVATPLGIDRTLALVGLQTPTAGRLAATRSAIDADERRLAALETQFDAAAAELARSRVEAGRIKASTDALASWSSLYALTDLVAALRRSEPFSLQLAVARAVTALPDDIRKLLDQLAPYAAIGVPDATRINREFAVLAGRLGWSGPHSAPVALVGRLLTWSRRQLPGSPSPVDETGHRLAEASAQLAAGDIAGAVDTVEELDSPARDSFADWLEDASARAAADRLASVVDLILGNGRPAAPAARP